MSLSPPLGYSMNRSSLRRGSNILMTIDWSSRHEVAAGATVVSATWDVMLNDAPSTDLSTSSPVVSSDGKKTQVKVSDVSSVYGKTYKLVCQPTLSDGTVLDPEEIPISIQQV